MAARRDIGRNSSRRLHALTRAWSRGEQLTSKSIAERFGVSRQAGHYWFVRLKRALGDLPRESRRRLDHARIDALHARERLNGAPR